MPLRYAAGMFGVLHVSLSFSFYLRTLHTALGVPLPIVWLHDFFAFNLLSLGINLFIGLVCCFTALPRLSASVHGRMYYSPLASTNCYAPLFFLWLLCILACNLFTLVYYFVRCLGVFYIIPAISTYVCSRTWPYMLLNMLACAVFCAGMHFTAACHSPSLGCFF
jgi:hypothetical protein